MKKQLLESGRNIVMYVAPWIIYNLLLKAEKITEI